MTNANWCNYFPLFVATSEISLPKIRSKLTQSQTCKGLIFRLAKMCGGLWLLEIVCENGYFRVYRTPWKHPLDAKNVMRSLSSASAEAHCQKRCCFGCRWNDTAATVAWGHFIASVSKYHPIPYLNYFQKTKRKKKSVLGGAGNRRKKQRNKWPCAGAGGFMPEFLAVIGAGLVQAA